MLLFIILRKIIAGYVLLSVLMVLGGIKLVGNVWRIPLIVIRNGLIIVRIFVLILVLSP